MRRRFHLLPRTRSSLAHRPPAPVGAPTRSSAPLTLTLPLTLGLLLAACATSAPAAQAQAQERPRLVVPMAVDQLRGDLLDRYDEVFTGGLRRLLDDGLYFTRASHAHARTSTAPGHATLATGVFPSRHAVVANSWSQRAGDGWVPMYAVGDADSPIVGLEGIDGVPGRSPRNMIREALPDWALAADDDARVVSISKKDRAAIPMGGLHGEHVYWMVPQLGRFVTSHYYRDDYPGWVEDFNAEVMPGITAGEVWESEVPERWTSLARPDSAAYEGYGGASTFPHLSSAENPPGDAQAHAAWVYDQSRADEAVLAFARVAIEELELGQRDEQDVLSISLSATDRIGHPYGPFSQEQLSNLIHLDRELGRFFDHLDEVVGAGAWLLALSADHGVATMPEAQQESGPLWDARRIDLGQSSRDLGLALRDAAGTPFDTPDALSERLARMVVDRELVAGAYAHRQLTTGGEPADSFAVLFRNSHYAGRAWGPLSRWGVEVRYGEGDYAGSATGTNHESTYWYDRWVPMIFLGPGIPSGRSETPVFTVDFAPTLAARAGIPVPDDLDGRVIF